MSMLEVPVLIVGGGGCGLTTSILLSDLGVDHLLVERHGGTSNLPKAHYLNQRTMEVLRQHGLADEVYAVGTPMANMGKVRWRTTLGGDGPLDAMTDEGWRYTLDVNVTSMAYSNRAAVRAFLAAGRGGVVLNMASVLAFSPSPTHFATHAGS